MNEVLQRAIYDAVKEGIAQAVRALQEQGQHVPSGVKLVHEAVKAGFADEGITAEINLSYVQE